MQLFNALQPWGRLSLKTVILDVLAVVWTSCTSVLQTYHVRGVERAAHESERLTETPAVDRAHPIAPRTH